MDRNKAKSIFTFLLVWFVWVSFEDKLVEIFNKDILPYLSNLEFSLSSNILFLILILFPVYVICRCFKNKYYIPILSFLLLCLVIEIYLKYRLFGTYISIPTVIANLGYTDILISLLGLFLISCSISFVRCRRNKNDSHCAFITDMPIHKPQEDILDYSESAKELAKDLEMIQVDNSCSIGIIAPWGTGKTSYLNLLEYHLNVDNFIIVKFNPRHSYNTKNIQEDFFESLFSELKKYDSRFSFYFKDYLKAINIVNDSKIIPFLLDIHKIWNKQSEKEKINRAIRRLNKRIVVIIDDFDRLLSDEIIEIFKLIDGNASFTNLIFITAYDKKRINDIIGKTYSDENGLFSDKFFTMEIQIPVRPYYKVYDYLQKHLFDNLSIKNEDKESYEKVLANHIDILKTHLTTLRDVKRFLNLFTRQFKQVQGEVEFKDYLLLYLIKYSHIDEYLNLYKKNYIEKKDINSFCLKSGLDVKSIEILKKLFPEKTEYTLRSINNEKAFNIYFYESVYDGLTIKDMKAKLFDTDASLSDAYSSIDSYASENRLEDVISFFDSLNILTFETKEVFERFLSLLVYINYKDYGYDVPYLILYKLIYKENLSQMTEKYGYDEEGYKTLITSKVKGSYPYYPSNIIKGILIGIINKEFVSEIIFSKEDVLQIAKDALNDLNKNETQITQRHIDLLYSCISDINQETRIVSLDKDACSIVRELIENNPTGYFENFVRLGMVSSNKDFNIVACEPYWQQIFGNAHEFESFIDSLDKDSIPKLNLVKNFWILYKNNGYKPIEFQNQGNVQDKINENLTKEVDKLKQLEKVESDFYEYVKTGDKKGLKDDSELKELLKQIDKIGLYIAKTAEIKRKIQNAIYGIS